MAFTENQEEEILHSIIRIDENMAKLTSMFMEAMESENEKEKKNFEELEKKFEKEGLI